MPALPVLSNPIFQKDFVALCRRKRWFLLRSLSLALLLGVLWMTLLTTRNVYGASLAEVGQFLFASLAFAEIGLLCLLVPGLVADLVVGERRRETLDILLVSPLKPLGILLGKLFSRVALVLVIVAASFPLLSVSLLYGGVHVDQLLALALVFASTVLALAGVGIMVSTFARRLGTAAVLSYILPGVYCVAVPVFAFAIPDTPDRTILRFLASTHPLFATLSVAVGDFFFQYRLTEFLPWVDYFLVCSAVAVASVGLAWLRLRRERLARAVGGSPAEPEEKGAGDPAGARRAAPDRARRGARRSLVSSRMKNPMLWKEIRLVGSSQSRALFWICAAVLILTTFVFFALVERNIDDAEAHLGLVTAEAFVLMVLVAVNSATGVVGEREQGTLDLVHVTLITPGQIVGAKLVGALRSVFWLALIPVGHLFLSVTLSEMPFVAVAVWTVVLAIILFFLSVSGLSASIAAKKPSRAILRSTGIFAILLFLPILFFALIQFATMGEAEEFAWFILLANPFALLGGATAICIEYPQRDEYLVLYTFLWFLLYAGSGATWLALLPERYAAHRRKKEGAVP